MIYTLHSAAEGGTGASGAEQEAKAKMTQDALQEEEDDINKMLARLGVPKEEVRDVCACYSYPSMHVRMPSCMRGSLTHSLVHMNVHMPTCTYALSTAHRRSCQEEVQRARGTRHGAAREPPAQHKA